MDLEDTQQEREYRDHVRALIDSRRSELPLGADRGDVEAQQKTQEILFELGLVGVTMATEDGGQGLSPAHQIIIDQELQREGVQRLVNWIGVGMCAPAIAVHGTPAQRTRYLPPLLRASELWCQLFSEPGAGSDLAGVRTKAVRDGDDWLVTGQKVWTTGAQFCDYGLALVRTNPEVPKHKGLTMFIIDMHAPGVTVRPLREMTGHAHFNEIFFDDVRLTDDMRVGAVDDGWAVAITMLMNERFTVAGDGSTYGAGPSDLVAVAKKHLPGMDPGKRAVVEQEVAELWIEGLACVMTGNRFVSAIAEGGQPGPEGSIGKLAAAKLLRRTSDLGVRLQGEDALFSASSDGSSAWQYIAAFSPGLALAGGTSEVMKNILGERVLGLAPEPRVAK